MDTASSQACQCIDRLVRMDLSSSGLRSVDVFSVVSAGSRCLRLGSGNARSKLAGPDFNGLLGLSGDPPFRGPAEEVVRVDVLASHVPDAHPDRGSFLPGEEEGPGAVL